MSRIITSPSINSDILGEVKIVLFSWDTYSVLSNVDGTFEERLEEFGSMIEATLVYLYIKRTRHDQLQKLSSAS